jgi:hypothetical protein
MGGKDANKPFGGTRMSLWTWKALCQLLFSPIINFFDSRFEATEREQELSDDEGDIEPESWIGNPNRKLWKTGCVRAALSVCPYEMFYLSTEE